MSYTDSFSFTNEDTFEYMTESDEARVSGGNKVIAVGAAALGVAIRWCNFNNQNKRRCTNAGREYLRIFRETYTAPTCGGCGFVIG